MADKNTAYRFRGRRLDNGEYIEGGYAAVPPPPVIMDTHKQKPTVCIVAPQNEPDWNMPYQMGLYPVAPESVAQDTGMTDKNGNTIWEKSRCRVTRLCVLCYGTIQYKNGCFCFVSDEKIEGLIRLWDIPLNGYEIEVIDEEGVS